MFRSGDFSKNLANPFINYVVHTRFVCYNTQLIRRLLILILSEVVDGASQNGTGRSYPDFSEIYI